MFKPRFELENDKTTPLPIFPPFLLPKKKKEKSVFANYSRVVNNATVFFIYLGLAAAVISPNEPNLAIL